MAVRHMQGDAELGSPVQCGDQRSVARVDFFYIFFFHKATRKLTVPLLVHLSKLVSTQPSQTGETLD